MANNSKLESIDSKNIAIDSKNREKISSKSDICICMQ